MLRPFTLGGAPGRRSEDVAPTRLDNAGTATRLQRNGAPPAYQDENARPDMALPPWQEEPDHPPAPYERFGRAGDRGPARQYNGNPQAGAHIMNPRFAGLGGMPGWVPERAPRSRMFSALLRESVPDLPIHGVNTPLQAPIGTPARRTTAAAGNGNESSTGSIPVDLGSNVDAPATANARTADNQETATEIRAAGDDPRAMQERDAGVEDTEETTQEEQIIEDASDSGSDGGTMINPPAVNLPAPNPPAVNPPAANPPIPAHQQQLVDFIKSGALRMLGDDVPMVMDITEPLPERASGEIQFRSSDPRIITDHERVGRRLEDATVRERTGASRVPAHVFLAAKYPLAENQLRRYPEVLERANIWRQDDDQSASFWNVYHSPQTLVEVFSGASEVLRFYNPEYFQMRYGSRVVVVKVDDLDSIIYAIRNGYWTNRNAVNTRLMEVWRNRQRLGNKATLYFLFSVSGAKQYCAMAEMTGEIDQTKTINKWRKEDCSGVIPLRFIYVKNVPFTEFADLPNGHSNGTVLNMWNGMVFEYEQGRTVLERYVKFAFRRNVLLFVPLEGPMPHFPTYEGGRYTYNRASGYGKHHQFLRAIKQSLKTPGEHERFASLWREIRSPGRPSPDKVEKTSPDLRHDTTPAAKRRDKGKQPVRRTKHEKPASDEVSNKSSSDDEDGGTHLSYAAMVAGKSSAARGSENRKGKAPARKIVLKARHAHQLVDDPMKVEGESSTGTKAAGAYLDALLDRYEQEISAETTTEDSTSVASSSNFAGDTAVDPAATAANNENDSPAALLTPATYERFTPDHVVPKAIPAWTALSRRFSLPEEHTGPFPGAIPGLGYMSSKGKMPVRNIPSDRQDLGRMSIEAKRQYYRMKLQELDDEEAKLRAQYERIFGL